MMMMMKLQKLYNIILLFQSCVQSLRFFETSHIIAIFLMLTIIYNMRTNYFAMKSGRKYIQKNSAPSAGDVSKTS